MLNCESLFVGERGTDNLWLNCQFSRKRNVIYYITILFAAVLLSPRPPNCIWNKPNLFDNDSLCSDIFPICKKKFEFLINSDFFYLWDRHWYFLINVLEDCIEFLTWAARALFNFYLKQKQRFSVRSFIENASFISFHRRIWSRYSEINKFKRSKGLSFQK